MKNFTWCSIDGQYYQVLDTSADKVLVLHPNATGPGFINVALSGRPLLVQGFYWESKQRCTFYKDELIAEQLPPIPFTAGLQIGSRCEWGTSFAEWAVVAIDGDNATIRQVRGWATAIPFDVPIAELKPVRAEAQSLVAA